MRYPLPALAGLSLALMVHDRSVSACPAHYVSQEALVRDARSIIEVEVLSVTDAPKDEHGRGFPTSSHKGAQAKVRVLNRVKGECFPEEFTLVGGPYASCSPTPEYLHFEKAAKLHLILDMPLTAACHTVVITCAGRVSEATTAELRELMAKAQRTWGTAVARHNRAVPEAMATAERLLASTGSDLAQLKIENQPFDVLCCLRILLNNPDERPLPDTRLPRIGQSLFAPGSMQSSSVGIMVTARRDELFLPPSMDATIERWGKEQSEDVLAFNLAMVTTLLRDELLVPEAFLASLTTDASVRTHLSQPNPDPTWYSLPSARDSTSVVISSLSALMMIAAPEPDYLVFGTFGSPQRSQSHLPEIFLPYLRRQGVRLLQETPRAVEVLLNVRHPEVAEFLRGRHENSHQTQSYFDFYASMSMVEELGELVVAYEKSVDEALAARSQLPEDPFFGDSKAYYRDIVKEMQQTLEDRKLEAPAVSGRLKAMIVKWSTNGSQ